VRVVSQNPAKITSAAAIAQGNHDIDLPDELAPRDFSTAMSRNTRCFNPGGADDAAP